MKRGRNQRRRQGVNPNRALDSNGPDVRIRGTANQIYDKYQALARDASSSGDRIKAESYLQHAEHYFRLIRATQQANQPPATQHDNDSEQPAVGGDEQPAAEGERDNGRTRDSRRERPQRRNGAAIEASNDDGEAESSEPVAREPKAEASDDDGEKKPRRRRTTRKKAVKKADSDEAGDDDKKEEPAPAAAAE